MEAARAAAVFAVDPGAVGGVALRAPAGPVRDRWIALVREGLPIAAPMRRVPLGVADGRLLGGLDLAATLRAGRPIAERGVLAECDGGVVVLAMAERLTAATAARIGATLDTGEVFAARDGVALRNSARLGVVALDEGMDADERPPAALLERMAVLLDLTGVGPREVLERAFDATDILAARALLPDVEADEAVIEALCRTAVLLGVASIRAPLQALRIARIIAALAGRSRVADEDAAAAARLVMAPRATRVPGPPPPSEPPPEDGGEAKPPEPENSASGEDKPSDGEQDKSDRSLDDLVLAASQAAIPADLLEKLGALGGPAKAGASGKSGALRKAVARGRPAGVRAGDPRGGRLNVVETLRAAAPWQKLRAQVNEGPERRIAVQRQDFRITRYEQRTETTIIFVVDASRSSAVNRLAEAKGAVELLLADCYVRRDQVAVLAFRGRGAELLLAPTRSLVRAKRQLAGLPGGGGTPLAAGLDAAALLADAVRRRGQTPTIVLLTDGRANVARDGGAGRERAEADALAAARSVRAARITGLLVDTAPRPQAAAEKFAAEMGARYLPLPYASAATLSTAVRATTEPPRRSA
jgi:magnesium chelatase subunit D